MQAPRDRLPLDLVFFEAECSTEVIVDSLLLAQLCRVAVAVMEDERDDCRFCSLRPQQH